MRLSICALVLLPACITASQAHIELHGTALVFTSPGDLEVASVGDITFWQELSFQADPPARFTGLGVDARVGKEPTVVVAGPIEVGQTMTVCRLGEGRVDLAVTAGTSTLRFDIPLGRCT